MSFRKWVAALVTVAVFAIPSFVRSDEPLYDLVIRNGRIVDGTGNPWFHGDVAIRGDRIVAVGRVPDGTAQREIDAKGLVVAPGFIDMHSHSDYLLLEDGHAQSKIRQGVTTEVLGEGQLGRPVSGQTRRRESRSQRHANSPGPRSAATSRRSKRPASPSTSPPTSGSTTSGNA